MAEFCIKLSQFGFPDYLLPVLTYNY